MVNSNPMNYLLSCHLVQGRAYKWFLILQEYNLKFITPKSTKSLVLASLMENFPSSSTSSLIIINFHKEFLFISIEDPWYGGILLYLCTHKFRHHLSHKDCHRIRHQDTRYILIYDVLYHHGVDTILHHFLTH